MDLAVRGLRVLITGGSAGIGLATAELLAGEGARLALASRHPAEAAARLGAGSVEAYLGTATGPAEAVERAAEELGGLDVLVNNVGEARVGTFEHVTDRAWQVAWETHVMSYVRAIRAALPHLRTSDRA